MSSTSAEIMFASGLLLWLVGGYMWITGYRHHRHARELYDHATSLYKRKAYEPLTKSTERRGYENPSD